MKIRLKRRFITRFVAGIALCAVLFLSLCFVLDRMYPPNLKRYTDVSPVVLADDGRILRAFTVEDGLWRLLVSYHDIAPNFFTQLIAFEDKRYWTHGGVDILALIRAVGQVVRHGRVVSGGSTLTMQVVRLLEPRPRKLASKLIEMARAIQLEQHYTKKEILQIYASLAPYGGNIEGVRAASLQYFQKEPKWLTPAQAALLVALPQSPTALRPDKYPKRARNARDKIIRRVLTGQAQKDALAEPLPHVKTAMPFLAPHLTRRLKQRSLKETAPKIQQSFIDAKRQQKLSLAARYFVEKLAADVSAAILVVENGTGKVVSYVGSADFFNRKRDGQVDMVAAVRSPGSTLKPFIYGLGFEDKMIHPHTIVHDVPTVFGDYAPKNFLRDFAGDVSVTYALQQSLNVPAVAVLEGVGAKRFAEVFAQAGAGFTFPDTRQGAALPIALGGVGLELEKLVMLYAAIARGGAVAPLLYTQEDFTKQAAEKNTRSPLFSAQTAGYLTSILVGIERPTGFLTTEFSDIQRKIAFKTGTSYGYRDAWAIGFSQHYTIGVWVGKPDGAPHYNFIGLDASKLLLHAFDIVLAGLEEEPLGVGDISDVPPALSVFPRETVTASQRQGTSQFRIMFPPEQAVLDLQKNNDVYQPIILKVKSGKRPYKWMVNGRMVGKTTLEDRFVWRPDAPGGYRITAMDDLGAHDTVQVWLTE